MKRLKGGFSLLKPVLIFTVIVFALNLPATTPEVRGQVTETSCTDSDGGLVYEVAGFVEGVGPNGWPFTKNDVCETSGIFEGQLREFYCNGTTPWPNFYACPNGCAAGACVPETCTDDDGDGYAIDGGGCGLVDCDDADANVNPGAAEVCDNGIDDDCDGAVDADDPDCGGGPSCTDSDGGLNYEVAGFVEGVGPNGWPFTKNDVCETSGIFEGQLREFYCNGTTPWPNFYACPNGCAAGACVPETCTDVGGGCELVWYDFEGDFLTSGIVTDRSDNGHNAQVNGIVDVANGVSSGQAILFSGNGYVQAESNPAAGRNTVSFSLWFKTDHPENNYKLASAAWWSGGPGSGWVLATHIPEFWSDDTQSLYLPDIPNIENDFPAGEWVHEVVTYDGNRIKEYTNGQLVNDWPTTGAEIGQGEAMVVGAWPPFSAYNFEGSIDEFRLFGWALTPQQVQEIYNQR